MEDGFIVGKKCIWQKVRGSEAGKPWTLKSGGGLEPRSLTEVYAYGHTQTHRRAWPQYILRRLRLTLNVIKTDNVWVKSTFADWISIYSLHVTTDACMSVDLKRKQTGDRQKAPPTHGLALECQLVSIFEHVGFIWQTFVFISDLAKCIKPVLVTLLYSLIHSFLYVLNSDNTVHKARQSKVK